MSALIQRGVVSSDDVFQGNSTAASSRPDVARADPWAAKPRINVLVPGPIATPQRRRSHPGEDPAKLRSADDAARAFLWLLGPQGAGTSGKTLRM